MLTFTSYISESKNLHLEHLEDSLFNEGSKGMEDAFNFCESLIDMLEGNSKSKVNVTVKWDGAPAIFAGINPENGKFFVGSKSIFNATPKINYTAADVNTNHGKSPGLAEKLKVALQHLPKLGIKGVLQGDLMFTTSDVEKQTIDGDDYLTFTPNTITYAAQTDSELAKQVAKAELGVVWHTTYTGKTLRDMKASFGANVSGLKKTKDVWFSDADFKDASGSATFTAEETKAARKQVAQVRSQFIKIRRFVDEFTSKKSIIDNLKIYGNQQVRKGNAVYSVEEFSKFVNDKMQKTIDSLKSERGKSNKQRIADETLKYLSRNKPKIKKIFDLHLALNEMKMKFVRKLERVKSLGMFIRTDSGYRVTSPEGFVAIDKVNKNAYKLVDRLEFSRSNFTAAKNWKGSK